jgi:hypothetical protein
MFAAAMAVCMTVKELKKAVEHLSPQELAEFRKWFRAFDEDAWDRQIAHDAEAGLLDRFADEAIADFEAGRAKEL